MTKRTLYLMITCCVESSRKAVLDKVIAALKQQEHDRAFNIDDDLIVFDNGSKEPKTHDLLVTNFKHVYVAETNLGYWSAIKWLLDAYPTILGDQYEYVHIIESDHTYYALDRIQEAEDALDDYLSIGSVRLQEYLLAERHRYNKDVPCDEGKPYAWVTHHNSVTGEEVWHRHLRDRVYESNFLTCLHSLNRVRTLDRVFDRLTMLPKPFSELDFQRMYHESYPTIAFLDGGILHAQLGCTIDDASVISGSWSTNVSQLGYFTTRQDQIRKYKNVKRIK